MLISADAKQARPFWRKNFLNGRAKPGEFFVAELYRENGSLHSVGKVALPLHAFAFHALCGCALNQVNSINCPQKRDAFLVVFYSY